MCIVCPAINEVLPRINVQESCSEQRCKFCPHHGCHMYKKFTTLVILLTLCLSYLTCALVCLQHSGPILPSSLGTGFSVEFSEINAAAKKKTNTPSCSNHFGTANNISPRQRKSRCVCSQCRCRNFPTDSN